MEKTLWEAKMKQSMEAADGMGPDMKKAVQQDRQRTALAGFLLLAIGWVFFVAAIASGVWIGMKLL